VEDTVVFIDEGFLDKLTRLLGEGIRLKYDKIKFATRISNKQNLSCKHLFYYTSPPFQSSFTSKDEEIRKKGYDKFISVLSKNRDITIREGRVQKITNEKGEIEYKQKGVDTLLTIDASHIKEDYPLIKKIVLVSSDTDFCPIIKDIKERYGIDVILYSYFDRERKSKFSLSNELLKCCLKYVQLTKEDFTSCPIVKNIDNNKDVVSGNRT